MNYNDGMHGYYLSYRPEPAEDAAHWQVTENRREDYEQGRLQPMDDGESAEKTYTFQPGGGLDTDEERAERDRLAKERDEERLRDEYERNQAWVRNRECVQAYEREQRENMCAVM